MRLKLLSFSEVGVPVYSNNNFISLLPIAPVTPVPFL